MQRDVIPVYAVTPLARLCAGVPSLQSRKFSKSTLKASVVQSFAITGDLRVYPILFAD